jgi:hypothetical protein
MIGRGSAQDAIPNLGEPLAVVSPYVDADKLLWLDTETLLLEPPPLDEDGDYHYPALTYHAPSATRTTLEHSPLYFAFSDERQAYFQMAAPQGEIYTSFISPFSQNLVFDVIYLSSLTIACGHECANGLIMAGQYSEEPDWVIPGLYHPLDVTASGALRVYWGRGQNVAVVQRDLNYGCCAVLYHITLEGDFPDLMVGYLDFGNHLHVISEDGTRVLYTRNQYVNGVAFERLVLWEAQLPMQDEPWAAERSRTQIPAGDDPTAYFSGANFLQGDDQHLLALHTDGIVQIDIATRERTLLNPNINATWIRLGVFSPDNRYLAIITLDEAVYVLETGLSTP